MAPRKRKSKFRVGDYALDREGRVVKIVRLWYEEGVEFAVTWYPNGELPYPNVGGRVAGTAEEPLWEHRTKNGKVVRPGGSYWNPDDWVPERGLRPCPPELVPVAS